MTEFVHHTIYNSVRIQGFLVTEYYAKRDEALKEMAQWVKEVSFSADFPLFFSFEVTEFVHHTIYNSIRIQGFLVFDFYGKRDKALKEMAQWVKEVSYLAECLY